MFVVEVLNPATDKIAVEFIERSPPERTASGIAELSSS